MCNVITVVSYFTNYWVTCTALRNGTVIKKQQIKFNVTLHRLGPRGHASLMRSAPFHFNPLIFEVKYHQAGARECCLQLPPWVWRKHQRLIPQQPNNFSQLLRKCINVALVLSSQPGFWSFAFWRHRTKHWNALARKSAKRPLFSALKVCAEAQVDFYLTHSAQV